MAWRSPFYITECVFLAVFCFEMAVKLVAKRCAFFNRWNSFDFTIVLGKRRPRPFVLNSLFSHHPLHL